MSLKTDRLCGQFSMKDVFPLSYHRQRSVLILYGSGSQRICELKFGQAVMQLMCQNPACRISTCMGKRHCISGGTCEMGVQACISKCTWIWREMHTQNLGEHVRMHT